MSKHKRNEKGKRHDQPETGEEPRAKKAKVHKRLKVRRVPIFFSMDFGGYDYTVRVGTGLGWSSPPGEFRSVTYVQGSCISPSSISPSSGAPRINYYPHGKGFGRLFSGDKSRRDRRPFPYLENGQENPAYVGWCDRSGIGPTVDLVCTRRHGSAY